jgi:isoquinoline 1-oxidoreductase beta subunit
MKALITQAELTSSITEAQLPASITRRTALQLTGLSIAFLWTGKHGTAQAFMNARRQPGDPAVAAADGNPAFAPNAFIRIDADGTVRLVMPSVEMGQGIYTGACMMLAEELGVGMDQIKVEHSPPSDELYGSPFLGGQITGGSTSTRGQWQVLREAGAVARTLLVAEAAQRWQVDPATLSVARGVVSHASSGRNVGFGALAKGAAALPMPGKVALKDPATFTLIGKPLRRVDSADKVTGATQFGIDVRVPGMKIATVMACPTFGGKLKGVDESKARAIAGVIDVIRLDNAVAVVGEHLGGQAGPCRLGYRVGLGCQCRSDDGQTARDAGDQSARGQIHRGARGGQAARGQLRRRDLRVAAAGARTHGAAEYHGVGDAG